MNPAKTNKNVRNAFKIITCMKTNAMQNAQMDILMTIWIRPAVYVIEIVQRVSDKTVIIV